MTDDKVDTEGEDAQDKEEITIYPTTAEVVL